jgi:hypothetical protein
MNEPENNLPSTSRSVETNETCENLRRQINLLFGALVITSFTLTAYLGLQARRASVDYIGIKIQSDVALKAFQQDNAAVESVFSKLTEFGRTHPDFQKQILERYKISQPPFAQPKK